MTLWEYLKGRMLEHSRRVALEDGTTYGELVDYIEERAKKHTERNRLVCVSGKSKTAHAIEILSVLASENVAVPVDDCYGVERKQEVETTIAQDKKQYPELAFIMFTSGTGGKPKGVMLSHENIIQNLKMLETYFALLPDDKILIARPIVHIAVIVGELLYGLIRGATIQFYEKPFLPQKLKREMEEKNTTVVCGTPTLFRNLLRVSACGFPLKKCVISGERLFPALASALSAANPQTEFYNVYGLTEHSPRVSALLPKDFARKAGSVGKLLAGVQTKIENGELLVKSPCVMVGYYTDAARTNAKIKNGWLYTGDVAHTDRDGYLCIDGRKDNMIIRSGLNVYPEEIEEVASACAGVENCVAYGEEDDIEGNKIVLKYCGEVSEQTLRKFLSGKLAPHLMPRAIKNVNALPATPSGKKVRKC